MELLPHLIHRGALRPSRLLNLAKRALHGRGVRLPYYPYNYMIDPTTACHLKCPHCFHGQGADPDFVVKKEYMSLGCFQTILAKIKDYALIVDLYHWGEPFLNPHLPEMIKSVQDEGIRCRISSNLSVRMSDELVEKIVASRLYMLVCSIDGPRQDVYEIYRRKGRLDLVLDNARRIAAERRRTGSRSPKLVYRMLVFEWNHRHVEEARRQAAEVGFDEFVADPGLFEIDGRKVVWDIAASRWKSTPFVSGKPCEWLFGWACVGANGRNMTCCPNPVRSTERLSLEERSLDEFWNNEEYYNSRRYALGLSDDRSGALPFCRKCPRLDSGRPVRALAPAATVSPSPVCR